MRLVLIALTLFAYWLVLSGHYGTWFNVSGGIMAVAVVLFCWNKGVTDREGFPFGRIPRGLLYWPWLLIQIVKSALNVTRIVLSPSLPISPTLVKVDAQQDSAVGLVTYANSITLTPGTISIEASEKGSCIWVHAIERDGAEGFADDEMNRKVAWFEKGTA